MHACRPYTRLQTSLYAGPCTAHRQGICNALLLALERRRITAAATRSRQRQQQGQRRLQLRLQLRLPLSQRGEILPNHRQSRGSAAAGRQLLQEAAAV